MTNSQQTAHDNLRLVFSAGGDNTPDSFERGTYELRLIDPAGATAMRFAVPADIIESVVFSQAEILISMAPDGTITAFPADADADFVPQKPIAVNVLVERAVTPRMLEDEPHAVHMLQTFRDRLNAAVKIVEDAIDKMSK